MEEIFEKFNKVMEQYNDAYTSAKDEKEQQEIDEKFEKLIDQAEEELEKWLEEVIENADAELEKEQQATVDELKAQEKKDEEERDNEEEEEDKKYLTEKELKKMKEKAIVSYAIMIWLEASIKDKRKETIERILKHIEFLKSNK